MGVRIINDGTSPEKISYEYLISVLRKRTYRRESQAEQDYFYSLWHDLLMLDAAVRKEVSEHLERGH
jgi:hypothetical protein